MDPEPDPNPDPDPGHEPAITADEAMTALLDWGCHGDNDEGEPMATREGNTQQPEMETRMRTKQNGGGLKRGTASSKRTTEQTQAADDTTTKRRCNKASGRQLRVGERFMVPTDTHPCAMAIVVAVSDAATRHLCGAKGQPYHVRVYSLPPDTDVSMMRTRSVDDCHVVAVQPAVLGTPRDASRASGTTTQPTDGVGRRMAGKRAHTDAEIGRGVKKRRKTT